MLLAVIYHPPYATAQDNNDLYNHVQATVDLYSSEHPECLICVVGDFKPNSTNISPAPFKRMCGLTQIVKVFTRDTGILDWCLTNSPKVFSSPKQLPKIGASDHYSVLVAPVIPSSRPSKLTMLQDFRYMKIFIVALRWRDEIKRSSQLRTLLKRVVGPEKIQARTGFDF